MPLTSGTRLGPYEILSPIGAGGMGEVYRAKDTRLDRIVAVKILPSHLSGNPQLRQRFEREARAISSISHPHICSLYDIGQQNGTDYLVMEFLEGESLSKRLDRGPLPTEQVLKYGIQIAEALDKAHRQGIVHRDLKPANVMLTKSGAKLLDFGLAKYQERPEIPAASSLETRDKPLTQEGVMLGTVQYMAPEQLEGTEADNRTDIFALGEILYEMSTGRRAFQGSSKAQLMASIISSEPPAISTIQPMAPSALERTIRKCLAKDADDRWQSAHDVASELRWISESTTSAATVTAIPRPRKILQKLVLPAAIFFFATTLFLLWKVSRDQPINGIPKTESLYNLSFPLPEATVAGPPGSLAISPNGRLVTFIATKEGQDFLWLRPIDSTEARQLPRTDGASYPFWSPDNHFIGFFAEGKLKKIDINGGSPQTLANAPSGRGGTWMPDGTILYTPMSTGGMYAVASEGGTPKQAITSSKIELSYRWPYALPDGHHFLFTVASGNQETSGVYLGSVDSIETKRLLPDRSRAIYSSGYIFFMRENNLMAEPFDAKTLVLKTEPIFLVSSNLDFDPGLSASSFSASDEGVLMFMNAGDFTNELVWVDRTGKSLGAVVGQSSLYVNPTLSPDGKKLAVGIPASAGGFYDVWIVELARGTFSRFTFDPSNDWANVWSPDGTKIVFSSNKTGAFDLLQKTVGGSGADEPFFKSERSKVVEDWSSDGKYVLYDEENPTTKIDMKIVPLFGDRKPITYLATEFNEGHGQFSPDGKWIVYVSDETGRPEVYLDRFPISIGDRRQISTSGGDQPLWRGDQKELFYMSGDHKLVAVEIKSGPTLEPGTTTALFSTHFTPNAFPGGEGHQYTVTKDGQRFLLAAVNNQYASLIHVVVNWSGLLKK
jgi:serine/threonine protein kinase